MVAIDHLQRSYHRLRMGFNPFRKQRKTATDVALVVGFIVLTTAAVLWGFFG